ncbi:hypothetical protein DV738_g2964, partial [Chaetothyriales sp. CBS 135597]
MAAPAPGNMHNLTTLIKRLEAATSRLEDIASTVDPSSVRAIGSEAQTPNGAIGAGVVAAGAAPAPAEPLPRSIEDFDALINEDVAAFVAAGEKLGGLPEEQAKQVQQAFQAERTYLLVSTKAKKPETQPPELMTDLHKHLSAIDELKESNRTSPLFTHLSAVAEGAPALGWIAEKRPADFVTEILGGIQYFGNKILQEYKEKDQTHVEFIQAYYKIFRSLAAYVKEHYATGLTWNQQAGVEAIDALKQIKSGTGSQSGGPPPPPPPPLPVLDDVANPSARAGGAASTGGDMSAVFSQLNQGSAVTAGLRKVDKSEMTHKNPSLRSSSTVPERSDSQSSSTRGKSPIPNKKPESMRTKKPGRKELDGTKWIVENFENTGTEVIEIQAELQHSILISHCNKALVKVVGKANAISIDNCSGLSILVDSLVSSLDVIKCSKFAAQINGKVPTLLLDQVDAAQLYLSEASLNAEIFTSKSSAINVVVPPADDADDSKELALPEQILSVIKNGKLVSQVVEHAG